MTVERRFYSPKDLATIFDMSVRQVYSHAHRLSPGFPQPKYIGSGRKRTIRFMHSGNYGLCRQVEEGRGMTVAELLTFLMQQDQSKEVLFHKCAITRVYKDEDGNVHVEADLMG